MSHQPVIPVEDGQCTYCSAHVPDSALALANASKDSAIADVLAERKRQDAQWGGPVHDDGHDNDEWAEFIARQMWRFRRKRENFVKVAALAVAAIESIDRKVAAAQDQGQAHHGALVPVRVADLNIQELAEVVQQFLDHAGITVHIEDRPAIFGRARRLELRGALITAPLPPQPLEEDTLP
jgi:hypothetical protein